MLYLSTLFPYTFIPLYLGCAESQSFWKKNYATFLDCSRPPQRGADLQSAERPLAVTLIFKPFHTLKM